MFDPTLIQNRQQHSSRQPLKEFGDYEIQAELGRGGMGIVYLAKQKNLNRLVALKMLTGRYGPDELRRFLEEAETAAGLSHTNIAHIYEVGEHDGTPFFSMEYVEGGTLADTIRKALPAPRDAAELLISVARAVDHAHQNGIVHRDMKPANVLIAKDGIPKVADFGIAKRLNVETMLTQTGAIIGTPTYMAPEQAEGNSRHVGPPADVYSLGAILYELLAGRPPFLPEDNETAITLRVLTEEPVSPAWHRPEIPRDLETICMKCLQKEPKHRYPTAGTLADDLRRFLNDESIHAKPQSSVVSGIKWVRRNPWKSVGSIVAVLLVLLALALLVRWELYVREHTEYAQKVEWVNGCLEPIEKVSLSKASRAAAYVRLTRRGRFGPVTKAEVLNSRGNPAVLRRVFNDEVVPVYIEGLTGAQPYAEKLPESTTVDFLVEDGTVAEATSRDRNGQVNWRLIYDRSSSSPRTARARFVNVRGFDSRSGQGASHMEFTRDDKGHDMQITFFDAAGKTAPNGEGVYGYKLQRDQQGQITRLENLAANGQPAPNRVGLVAFTMTRGQQTRFQPLDASGQPVVWGGIAAIVTDYDGAGNVTRITSLASDGQPVHDEGSAWSVQEVQRNNHGEVTQRKFLKADPSGSLQQISQTDVGYDEFGHPADIKFNGLKSWRSALHYDANGNVIEEKFLDANGNPVIGDNGYASTRSSYTSDNNGTRTEQTYFDASGNKTYNKSGYHRFITEFDVTGVLKRLTMDEHDPARFSYYRYVSEPEFDAEGRNRHSVSRYEDANGQLAKGSDLPYLASEVVYDENGRVTSEWRTVSYPQSVGGPILRFDTEWNANGKKKSVIRQVCDENRQPLAVVSNGNSARHEEHYDFVEQLERIYESGFNEQLVGFSTREVKFSGGSLQVVKHTRGDGGIVPAVAVIITEVIPPAEQPKSAELKVGDQLFASNGKTVTSAYAWVYAGKFPGGWIEVVRDGRHIRIEGLNPGILGIALEDHALK
jgi:predicted Ser/Thr protein kinase